MALISRFAKGILGAIAMGLDYNLAEYSGRYETLVQNHGHDL